MASVQPQFEEPTPADESQLEHELQVPPELEVPPEGSHVLGSLSGPGSLSGSWVLLPEDDDEQEQGDEAASITHAPCTIDSIDATTSDACVSEGDALDGDLSTSVILDAMDECQSTGSDDHSTTAFVAAPPSPAPEPLFKPLPVALDAPLATADAKACKEVGVEVARRGSVTATPTVEALLDEPSATNADCHGDKGARRHVWERRVLLAVLLLSTHAAALCIGIAIGSRKGGGSEASSSLLTRRYSSGPYNSSTPWLSLASSSRLCRS